MRILAVDVGTGTQDILLFDSEQELENSIKLVLPSPTRIVAGAIRRATDAGRAVVLRGVTMGGGPSSWAANDHLKAGYAVFATPDAARTFDDDLEAVAASGIVLLSDDEAGAVQDAEVIELGDLSLDKILAVIEQFGGETRLDALAVAVFDHGAAPPGYSDRVFRFDYLTERLRTRNSLTGFAYLGREIPPALTRLAAVATVAPASIPLVVMDTAPAAVLGALEDPVVAAPSHAIVANVGNFHCLAFRLDDGWISGLFEHHSGELTASKLRRYVEQLAEGTISNEDVFRDMGHGALMLEPEPAAEAPFLAVTGPRRALLQDAGLAPYLAVPHGDMMLTGCFGLLRACAARDASMYEAVLARLGPTGSPASG